MKAVLNRVLQAVQWGLALPLIYFLGRWLTGFGITYGWGILSFVTISAMAGIWTIRNEHLASRRS